MPRRTESAPKRLVTPRTSSTGAPAGTGGVVLGGLGVGAHLALERAISRSNWTFSAIAKMITTPT